MSLFLRYCPGFSYSYSSRFIQSLKVQYKAGFDSFCIATSISKDIKQTLGENNGKSSIKPNKNLEFIQYDNMVEIRRKQAERSILVQVHSEQSHVELYEYCHNIAPVENMFYYSLGDNHYILVEFKEDSFKSVVERCTHLDKGECIPVQSPMLWFRAHPKGKSSLVSSAPTRARPLQRAALTPSQEVLNDCLISAQNLSDQMLILYNSTRLDEVGTRLRFLTGRQLELGLNGLFPLSRALPFGSSVNGFGKAGCDLDLVLIYNTKQVEAEARLVFQSKGCHGRSQTQRQMEALADLLHVFLPGCNSVKRILQARVPIVKYNQEMTGVDCDLSLTNMTAVYMSELLYLWGEWDSRLRPLVITIKSWAAAVGLTHPAPGRWITNFSLTLLVIFYMQRIRLLPSLSQLIKAARPEDVRFADEINCTFLRDLTRLDGWSCRNEDGRSLESLLRGFFEFYTTFDFGTSAMSVLSGTTLPKPDFSTLYIVNPLERSLNVSKNVSPEETEHLRMEVRNALWLMDSGSTCLTILLKPSLEVHARNQRRVATATMFTHQNRIVAVKDLFN